MRSLEERFWEKVDVRGPDECWPWMGCGSGNGYGLIRPGGRELSPVGVHRLVWELHHGPIPEGSGHHGTCVLHHCDNRLCCNVRHLFLGTNQDNMDDMNAKGRGVLPVPKPGSQNPNSRLTEQQVLAIRAATADGESPTALGRRYGVSRQTIWRVTSGGHWRHLQEAAA